MFNLVDNFRVAVIGVQSNKLRSILTMLGITIGVAAVIVLLSMGQAVSGFVRGQLMGLGSNLLFVFPMEDEDGVMRQLTMSDVEALQDHLRAPSLSAVMPMTFASQPAVYENKQVSMYILGTTPEYTQIINRWATAGRFFTQAEVDNSARVAAIGPVAAERLFGSEPPTGKSVRIGAVRFEIIGVLNLVGDPEADDALIVPVSTFHQRLSGEREAGGELPVFAIGAQAVDEYSTDTALREITRVMRDQRDVRVGEEDSFQVFSQAAILDSLTAILGLLTVFLGVIAGISLLVGGIGVMNIMLVTVTERTREIGLRKAVGARSGDIVTQFLIESMVITLVGGAIGIGIAFGLASLVTAAVPDLSVSIEPSSIALATIISASVGIFFGIYPARRAAALNPIDALRYE